MESETPPRVITQEMREGDRMPDPVIQVAFENFVKESPWVGQIDWMSWVPKDGGQEELRQFLLTNRLRRAFEAGYAAHRYRPAIWWCEVHKREATHTGPEGFHVCDPALGGITLPCRAKLYQSTD